MFLARWSVPRLSGCVYNFVEMCPQVDQRCVTVPVPWMHLARINSAARMYVEASITFSQSHTTAEMHLEQLAKLRGDNVTKTLCDL